MLEMSGKEVRAAARENKSARLGDRRSGNRLEPECWPTISPTFQLDPAWRIFAIGSCFARNIEYYLERLGFEVPTRRFLMENAAHYGSVGREILNKYTPPSIYQELEWTRHILDRDDQVRADDIEPFLLPLKNGNVIDLQRRFRGKYGLRPEEALTERRKFYSLFRQAFACEAIVVTLGLIECWWDRSAQLYVEFDPSTWNFSEDDRFVFRLLDYQASYDYVRRAIDLLNRDAHKKILITTSPVSLRRTFTRRDVIVANMQSKSVLRAVAGQISEDIPGVDYFPSYESVVLTRQPYVWEDDLAHVSPDFVGRIMSRVYAAYVPGASLDAIAVEDEILRFQTLVGDGAYDEAKAIYLTLGAEALKSVPPRFDVCAAELSLLEGDRDLALKHADRAVAGAVELGGADFESLLRAGMVYEKLGLRAPAGEARSRAFDALRVRPAKSKSALSRYLLSERHEHAAVLLPFMEAELADDLQVMEAVAHGYKKMGRDADAERICRKGLSRDPDNSRMKTILFTMIRADPARAAEATSLAEDLLRDDPENPTWLRRLCKTYQKAGRHGEAASLARRLLAVEPENVQGRRVLERSVAMSDDLAEPEPRAIGRSARAR